MPGATAEVGKVGARGQVTIPKKIREDEDLEPGDHIIIAEEDGTVIIEKLDVEQWRQRVREIEEEEYDGDGPTAEEVADMIDD